MDIVTLALAKKQAISSSNAYTDGKIEGLELGFNYKGSVASVEDLPVSGNQKGDEYTIADGSGSYAWNGTSWDPAGAQGPQGRQGEQGEQGPAGRDGAIHYTPGTGIEITDDNVINNTQTSAEWGNIEGSLSNQTDLNSALETKASLVNGRIPLQQMPEFVVADVVEVETYEDLPATGETNTLYHVVLTDSTYRWVGNHYLLISQQSNFYSLLIDTNLATMGALKEAVDSVNAGGDHVFFDLHQLVNEGYVCTVHFWDETVGGTVHHYCEINDILNDRLYGIKQEWTNEQLVSAYCSSQGLMYDVKKVSINGTALSNDRGFVDIPIASASTPGVVIPKNGLQIVASGNVNIVKATDSQLVEKTNSYNPVVPANLNKAVMEGLGNNGLTWTDAYKASARNTLGIKPETSFACEMVDGTTKTLKLYSELI